jgi:aspartyl-tRNA(Asn)/glutamyl-tRNA(Gln) amidotransferase subunit A
VRGWRIALSLDLGYAKAGLDPEVVASVMAAAQVFADLGAQVEQVDPGFPDPLDTFNKHWYTGAANALSTIPAERLALIEPGLREIAEQGAAFTHMDYIEATNARGQLGQAMSLFHERYDLLLTPTLPIPAFTAGQETPDANRYARWPEWTPFSYPFNLSQQPAASVPCGFTRSGLPIGLQIVGPMHRDDRVLQAARAYESIQPIVLPDAPRVP